MILESVQLVPHFSALQVEVDGLTSTIELVEIKTLEQYDAKVVILALVAVHVVSLLAVGHIGGEPWIVGDYLEVLLCIRRLLAQVLGVLKR